MAHKLKKPAPKAAAPKAKASSSGARSGRKKPLLEPADETKPATAKAPLANAGRTARVATKRETELLDRINVGFSESQARRFQELDALRRQERLTHAELAEFRALADASERIRNDRFEALVELAGLHGLSVSSLMARMGLGSSDG